MKLRFEIRRFWAYATAAVALTAPFQSVYGAEPAVGEGVRTYFKLVRQDLDRVAYLADVINRKIEAQNASVCAGGRELDQLNAAFNKMNSDFNKLAHRTTVEAPALLERVHEETQTAYQTLGFFRKANLKSHCRAAAKGNSAKALAHVNITLQVTQKDIEEQRDRTIELQTEATQTSLASAGDQ